MADLTEKSVVFDAFTQDDGSDIVALVKGGRLTAHRLLPDGRPGTLCLTAKGAERFGITLCRFLGAASQPDEESGLIEAARIRAKERAA